MTFRVSRLDTAFVAHCSAQSAAVFLPPWLQAAAMWLYLMGFTHALNDLITATLGAARDAHLPTVKSATACRHEVRIARRNWH